MPTEQVVLLSVLFLLVGGLYASVGHAGASGYLAVMAIVGTAPESMRTTALSVNVVVASIAFAHYCSAGHFSWRFLLPFAIGSFPMAFLGGTVSLPEAWLRIAIGATLAFAAARTIWTNRRPAAAPPVREPDAAVRLLAGGAIGFVAGVTGTGGGIFLSPLLILMGWAEPRRVAATASLFILINSVSGLAGIAVGGWSGGLDPIPLGAAAAAGGLLGGHLGARRATPRALNLLLSAVLAIAAAKLLVGGIGAVAI